MSAVAAKGFEKIDVMELLGNNPQWGPPFDGDIDCQAFYELAQNYRWAGHVPKTMANQADTCQAYELLMDFIREWAKRTG